MVEANNSNADSEPGAFNKETDAQLAAVSQQEQRRTGLRARYGAAARVVETDVLVIGGGAGGLWAALSAGRQAPPGMRVTLVDAAMVGRTGHTAFSNAWMVVATPDDDLDACVRDIVEGNEWMADQLLVRDALAMSYERVLELEQMGVQFPRDDQGNLDRRPTRGLRVTKVVHPVGGGLVFCWQLRQAVEAAGVQVLDRIFITGLMKAPDGRLAGAVGVDGRTGEFYVLRAKATVVATNSVTFRSGFVRDITGTGTLLAYQAGATLTFGEFSYLRPGTPKFYFEGITFAIQDGARFVNSKNEQFMQQYEPDWGDRADVPRIAAAFCLEKKAGNAPLYLDMSLVPEDKRDNYFHSTVKWMDLFLAKLDTRARIDMFGRTQYYPLNQMAKLAIKTDRFCRSDVPGLLAAGLAQAGCATHFAGFHIGMCTGSGWIAGRSAVEDAAQADLPTVPQDMVDDLRADALAELSPTAIAASDEVVRELQRLMFRFDVTVLKQADRLHTGAERLGELRQSAARLAAADPHELVRVKELHGMLQAAEMILRSSEVRTETRLSHLREDYPDRDDAHWLKWVLLKDSAGQIDIQTAPMETPLVPCEAHALSGQKKAAPS